MANFTIQRWTPDTCSNSATRDACVIEERWDKDVVPEERVHTLIRVVNKCSAHEALTDKQIFEANKDENYRKNLVLSMLRVLDENIKIHEVSWSFNQNRILLVTMPGNLEVNKSVLQAQADVQFGSGKVIVS